ncbi:MAG: HAMP domain-containing histidine kinase [Verrucomicrobiae bacterium]|nr:HAMP domain-containing histidine kinase [Verrucomicrobiae bacterium]
MALGIFGFLYLRHESVIAEQELRQEAKSLAYSAAKRLDDAYQDYVRSEEIAKRGVSSQTIDQTGTPTPRWGPSGVAAFSNFREIESDPDALSEAIATFDGLFTPAGLPLKPIAQLQLARLYQRSDDVRRTENTLKDLLIETVENSPSPISYPMIEAAESLSANLAMETPIDFEHWKRTWKAKEATRNRLRRGSAQILRQLNVTRWFYDLEASYFWTDLPNGDRIALSKTELEQLAGDALAELWPLARNGANPLTFRITFERQSLLPVPFGDPEVKKTRFEEVGYREVTLSPHSRELASAGTSTPFSVWVHTGDWEGFRAKVRQRTLRAGALLGVAWLALGTGFWKTWRTLVLQQRLNQQQANLISSISHELRTPVAGIRLLAERLSTSDSARSERDQKYARLVTRETERLTGLIDNILDTGRIADGRKQYEFEWIDLHALLRETAVRYTLLASDEDKVLTSSLPDAVELPLLADPIAVQQAIGNLLDNALKFSAPGSEVKISVQTDETDSEAIITVADHGPGIEAGDLPRIFDLFYRGQAETQRATTGTGLGLFLVRSIAEAHGGRVEAASEVGSGSEFRLIFPLSPEPVPDQT